MPVLRLVNFREYGILVTDRGIYTAYQCEYNKEVQKNTKKKYYVKSSWLNFKGLKSVRDNYTTSSSPLVSIFWTSINNKGKKQYGSLTLHNTIAESVLALCKQVIESGISAAMYDNTIYEDNRALEAAQLQQKNLEQQLKTESVENNIQTAAVNANNSALNNAFNEVKNYMNGSRGGGYAAEYANNASDRLLGKNVESTAQVLDSRGRQVKNGADRTVDGLEIQTKYYKTAQESIGAAFENKQARYIRSDGSGKMMPIEVPRDQYDEALKLMQKRINDGQVPGIELGEDAASYVKKGIYTYTQANNTAISGTIESLAVDSATGVVYTTNAAGISALMTFATQIWHGKSVTDAAQSSLAIGTKVLGTGAVIYIATMQLTRDKIANPLIKDTLADGTLKSVGSFANPIASISESIVTQIQRSAIAKTQLGNIFGLTRLTSQQFIAGTLAGVITFGPDLIKALNGKISGSQLFKNSTVAAAGIVGAGVGNTIAPVIGGIIGGAVAGYVAKKIADEFVKDDAISMFQILKEEFIEQVSLANLTNDELDRIVSMTVGNEDLSTMLENMYASENYRYYASERIVRPAIKSVLSKRKKITQKAYIEGLTNVLLAEQV